MILPNIMTANTNGSIVDISGINLNGVIEAETD
jgi:hypothetical protein